MYSAYLFHIPGVIVPVLGKADAKPDFGSKAVTDSPPRFREITESGSGVNLQRIKKKKNKKPLHPAIHVHNIFEGGTSKINLLLSSRISLFSVSCISHIWNT